MIWRSRVAGRARTIGNRVYPKRVSRVQIPPSPPKSTNLAKGLSIYFLPIHSSLFTILYYRFSAYKSEIGSYLATYKYVSVFQSTEPSINTA